MTAMAKSTTTIESRYRQGKLTGEPVLPADIVLRMASRADQTLCETLFIEMHQEPLQFSGWDALQCRAYLSPQFSVREQALHSDYPGAEHYIIVVNGMDAGRLLVDRQTQAIHIIDMALLSLWCGRGIGRHLLNELCREADSLGKTICLHVAYDNPALNLYRRFGFEVMNDNDVYLTMRRRPELPYQALCKALY